MNIVLDLPGVLQVLLVCKWLKLSNVVRLDSAFCCKKLRADFHAIIGSPQSIFSYHMFESDKRSDARWVISRNIKFKSVLLLSENIKDDELNIALYMQLACPALESVILSTYFDNNCEPDCEQDITTGAELFIMAINSSCPNLTKLYIESGGEVTKVRESLVISLLSRCKKLSTFVLQNCRCGSNALLQALYAAPSLERVSLTGGRTKDKVQDIPLDLVNRTVTNFDCKEFSFSLSSNTNIGHMCLHFSNLAILEATDVSNADLVSISTHCPLLQDVTIFVSEVIRKEAASQAARNWPHLYKLAMHRTKDPLPEYPDAGDRVVGKSCTETALLFFIHHCPLLIHLNTMSRSSTYQEQREKRKVGDSSTESTKSNLYELYTDSLTIGGFRLILARCKCLYILAIHQENPYHYEVEAADTNERPLESALHFINRSSIKVLYVHNYTNLSGVCLQRLGGLQEINFSHANPRKLDDKDILKLVSRCPGLRSLSLKDCFPVRNNFVLVLLDQCPTLRSLIIENKRPENTYRQCTTSTRMLETLVKRLYPQMYHFDVDCQYFC